MSAYVIANFNVQDDDKLKQYGAAAAETLGQFGGQYIAKGKTDRLHGQSIYSTAVIIQFPSKEAAKNWYLSDEYQKLIAVRNEAMNSEFHLLG